MFVSLVRSATYSLIQLRIDLYLFSDSCSYSLTGVRGNFTSPDYPQHYSHDLDCSWTITVSAGYYIYLHFEHFHLEDGGSHCPFDYVQIFDGSLASNPITTKRCAYQDSWCVYSHSNVVTIILITDGSVSHPGFSAYYERVHQPYPHCSVDVSTSKVVIFLRFLFYVLQGWI